jgi:hypothetical protein
MFTSDGLRSGLPTEQPARDSPGQKKARRAEPVWALDQKSEIIRNLEIRYKCSKQVF